MYTIKNALLSTLNTDIFKNLIQFKEEQMRLTSSKCVAISYKKREEKKVIILKKNRNNSNKGRKHNIFFEEPPRKIDMIRWILTLSVTIALYGNTVAFITRKYFDSYCTIFFKVSIHSKLSRLTTEMVFASWETVYTKRLV